MKASELQFVLLKWFSNTTVCTIDKLHLKEGIYIVNTDCGTGRHWVALYVTDKSVEFFDSFGQHPKYIQNGVMFMKAIQHYGKPLIIHSKRLQHYSSKVCGVYCLAYVLMRAKDCLSQFFAMFDGDRKLNDKTIVYIVNRLM
jgi:hypothetical protein